jgi:hypothetical protein
MPACADGEGHLGPHHVNKDKGERTQSTEGVGKLELVPATFSRCAFTFFFFFTPFHLSAFYLLEFRIRIQEDIHCNESWY